MKATKKEIEIALEAAAKTYVARWPFDYTAKQQARARKAMRAALRTIERKCQCQ